MTVVAKTVSNGYGVFRMIEIFFWTKLHFQCNTQTIFCLYRVRGYTSLHLPQIDSVRYMVYYTEGDNEAAAFMTPCATTVIFVNNCIIYIKKL